MRLDVVIPTYNRATLLARTCESLLAAERPDGLDVSVIVVDNRSTDETHAVVKSFMSRFDGRLQYLYEDKAGRSHALNAGIAATIGDLVGMIDDDEEVDRHWFTTVAAAFADPKTDFIGGPYVPRWGSDPPPWLNSAYQAAIGWVNSGSDIQVYGPRFDGILMGGNAVVRRHVLERVGAYSADLGRSQRRLLACEDRDMYDRLLASGARGFYRPDLIIYHYVSPERLTKAYVRRWSFWHGVSLGLLDRRRPESVPYLFGVPRYRIGAAVRAACDTLRYLFRSEPARVFKNELAWWDLSGFFYGKHVFSVTQGARGLRRS
jgi:glucosyl-dolichyl phosphate glucuronosyltransferase